jgi:N-acetylglucosaminyldiphosphoundecaprenol N-acetyl-beta-D-mannosaminyltransferase
MVNTPKTTVLGLPLHILADYSDWLVQRLQAQQPTHVVTLNSEMAMQAQQDLALAKVIDHAELVIPDGAGVVLYLRLRGQQIQRHPGIEVAESLLRQAATQGWSVFFLGGKPDIIPKAVERWQQEFPGFLLAGMHHGYFSPEEEPGLVQTLVECQPQIILVGLGVPRQEFWINQHRHCCPHAIWIGVGGSFDIWAGVKSRAPGWLRNNNLEWVYRLYQEPWRWRRMLVLPQFAWKALLGQ